MYTGVCEEHCTPYADTLQDQFRRGYLQALRDVRDIQLHEESQ